MFFMTKKILKNSILFYLSPWFFLLSVLDEDDENEYVEIFDIESDTKPKAKEKRKKKRKIFFI